jgi:hypothetical protein
MFCPGSFVPRSSFLDPCLWMCCLGHFVPDSRSWILVFGCFVLGILFLDPRSWIFILGILFLDYYSWRCCPGFCAYWALRALGVIGTGSPGSIKGFFASKAGCFKDVSGRGSMREVKE